MDKLQNIFNCDNVGFDCDQGLKTVLIKRGARQPLIIGDNNEKVQYTVNNCCNANGDFLHLCCLQSKTFLGSMGYWWTFRYYTVSPAGWMEEDQFVQWINSVFIPFKNTNCEGRVVLIADDHLTHVTMTAIQLC